jgi:hypothetical protein
MRLRQTTLALALRLLWPLNQEEAERHNEWLTIGTFTEEVDLARSLIAHLGEIFASGGTYTPSVAEDPVTPVLALGARCLNSAWCSHRMILQGHLLDGG